MIADKSSVAPEIESFGTPTKQVVGGMSLKNLSKIIDIITTQLYSNPIGTIVRELTSNCFDAHIKLQKRRRLDEGFEEYVYDQPVIVKYSEEEGQGFISFIDVGTGLSPIDMEEIYINIGTSDKENDNDALGYYGIGSKSFLSYTPSIDLVTINDGIKYTYIVAKNADGLLAFDLLLEEETSEHTGTEVKICIGQVDYRHLGYVDSRGNTYDYKALDYPKFRKEVITQLHYFDNVYTVGFDLENDYKLYEAETFKVRSGDNPFKDLHIILGKVAYPIDWEVLGRDVIPIPVGIKFEIGELFVTPSREAIRYDNDDKKTLINQRIDLVLAEIRDRYNKNASQVETLEEYIKHAEQEVRALFIGEALIIIPKKQRYNSDKGEYYHTDIIEGLEDVKWKPLAHLPITIPKDPYFFFSLKGRLSQLDGRGNAKLEPVNDKLSANTFKTVKDYGHSIYRIKGDRTKTIDAYIIWKGNRIGTRPFLLGRDKASFFKFETELELGKKVSRQTSNQDLLGKKKIFIPMLFPIVIDGKTQWWNKTKIIQEYKKAVQKDLVSRTLSYDKETPDVEYLSLEQLKRIANKKKKLEGVITVYDLVNDNSSTSSTLNLSTLEKWKGFIIYGEREKLELLRGAKDLVSNVDIKYNKTRKKLVYAGKTWIHTDYYHKRIRVNDYQYRIIGGGLTSRTFGSTWKPTLRPEVGKVFITAKANHKLLQGNPYYMHIDEFMSNGNRVFRNSITAYYLNKELKLIGKANDSLIDALSVVNDRIFELYNKLELFANKHYRHYYSNEEFMEACLTIAEEKDLLWKDKIEELKKVRDWFNQDLTIFNFIDEKAYKDPSALKDIISLLRLKGIRVSTKYYLLPVEKHQIIKKKEVVEEIKKDFSNQQLIYKRNKKWQKQKKVQRLNLKSQPLVRVLQRPLQKNLQKSLLRRKPNQL